MRRRILVAALAAPWILWALARTLGLERGHPLVALMALTPYAAATAPVPLALALAVREWLVAALAALALAALAVAVVPRGLPAAGAADAGTDGPRLVVMTANLRYGRADARAVVRLVREHRVDALSLQELTPAAVAGLDRAGLRALLPNRALEPRPRAAGIGLMARRPLATVTSSAAHGRWADLLQATLAAPVGEPLHLVAVHPFPPIDGHSVRSWRATLDALPAARAAGRRHLLVGDFNATLDHRILRRLLARGYSDAADASGDGLRPTWPVGGPWPPIAIDHVLVPPGVRVRRVTIHEIAGTDHRALIAELVLPTR